MTNLFFIESPFQLLCAYEAIYQNDLKYVTMIIRLNNQEKNNQQLLNLLDYEIINKVYIVKIISFKHLFYNMPFLLKIMLFSKKINKIYIGDYRGKLMTFVRFILKNKQITILDDGLYTLNLYSKMKSKEILTFDLFSVFDFNPLSNQHNIEKNKMLFFKKKLNMIKQIDCVYFFGAATSEAGYLHEEIYVSYINKIKQYYEKQRISFLYIPHRRESLEKFNHILDLNIYKFENPAEIQIKTDKEVPIRIASFYSTVLVTLKLLYNIEYIDSFTYNYNDILKDKQNEYKENELLLKKFDFIKFHIIQKLPDV
jgi:hypothetical protein